MRKRWGWYLVLLRRKHFKVKLLYFKEGGAISMQRHKHRDELWLWIFGTGTFDNGNFLERLYHRKKKAGGFEKICGGGWHKFTASKPTLVLEIQYGDKCSERDIERA